MDKEKIFVIRPINEEGNRFIITVGRHKATEKEFESVEAAEMYIDECHWDMIVAVVAEMIEIHDLKDEMK